MMWTENVMTPERISELRKLCSGATPGPWVCDGDATSWDEDYGYAQSWVVTPTEKWRGGSVSTGTEMCQQMTDAAFIAEARTALPEALDEIERLRSYQDDVAALYRDTDGDRNDLRSENARLREAAAFAQLTIEHAIHLGYLGEGSTKGMAEEALGKLRAALEGSSHSERGGK